MKSTDPDHTATPGSQTPTPTNLRIPTAGSELTLTKDWTFRLYLEGRNSAFIKAFGVKFDTPLPQFGAQTSPFTLPAGTRLKVCEYSIRRGGFSPDSRIVLGVVKGARTYRIWVGLEDANSIEAT